ncbi:MAG: hypothetical protein J0L99_09405 [Chitinophagales bacterium]|nr:hypothetical protein [Chitinophagales bacterium]
MKIKMTKLSLFLAALLVLSCKTTTPFMPKAQNVAQLAVSRIEKMPRNPQPWRWKDWHQTAQDFDRIAFNYQEKGDFFPIIWEDNAKRNGFEQSTFGLYTALGDVREGPGVNNGENHEALGAFGALIGASLVGIDKSNQHGRNYATMMRNYINRENGWNIVMNFTNKGAHIGGGYGNDWWYDVLNNVLYFALADQYPNQKGQDELLRGIADQFLRSDAVLGNSYSYSFFDFKNMKAEKNHIPAQEDVAAGYAFILYAAWVKFGDAKYLKAAQNALTVLESQRENRSYEILMSFGPYMAARMNAETGSRYDVQKMMNWTFDGDAVGREGWGVIVGNWGGYDVSGMMGSTVHNGGYGFLMNTFQLAWTMPPTVRYDQRYARAVGRWALNAANTARFFYPSEMPDSLQALPQRKALTKGVIAYEGLIKESIYEQFKGITPFAQGDGPLWAKGMPQETQFSVYGSAYVGFFGGVLRPTNVDQILQVNCTATDFFKKGKAWPTYLYYNPHTRAHQVELSLGDSATDVYDAASRQLLLRGAKGKVSFEIGADAARLLVLVPAGSRWKAENGRLIAGGRVVDYRY